MSKKFTCICLILISFLPQVSFAQVGVTWQKWPAALQLYPRDDQNTSEVPIVGKLQTVRYSHASVWVSKNGARWKYQRTTVVKGDTESAFELSPRIEAGLNQYKFDVYAVEGSDSVLVDTRDNIVCGDVILFNGQSNLTGFYPSNYTYKNNFARTFGNRASLSDTLWRLANVGEGQVGLIGIELQRLILENYGMPTCLINGSVGGSSIKSHIYRNSSNPADVNTMYGKLLYWAQKAGVASRVKAFVWRQGENEAGGGDATGYEQDIHTLFGHWQTDFTNVGKYYVAQVNLLPDGNRGAGQLRDFQRRVPQIFPRTEAIATVGLPAYDGVHYGQQGQYQFANELFRLIARDCYQSMDINGITSPSIRKAYYLTSEKKEVVLEFEPGASMVWQQNETVNGQLMDIRDFIYFDYANNQQERVIASGWADGNRIILKLTKAIQATKITYLPHFYKTPFGGPFLKNNRGMRAFTFHNVTIDTNETTPPETPPTTGGDGPLTAGCYSIRAKHSGKFLEVADANANTRIRQQTGSGNSRQIFKLEVVEGGFYRITSRSSDKVWDVSGAGTSYGTAINQQVWVDAPKQKWQLSPTGDGTYHLHPSYSTTMLVEVDGGSQDNNKALILARKTTSSHQRFYLQGVSDAAGCPTVTPPTVPTEPTTPPVEPTTPTTPPSEPTPPITPTEPANPTEPTTPTTPPTNPETPPTTGGDGSLTAGCYTIRAKHSGKFLEVADANANTRIRQQTGSGNSRQIFKLEVVEGGFYRITSRSSDKVWDVSGAGTSYGTAINQQVWVDAPKQKWQLSPTGDGTYHLHPSYSTTMLVEVDGGSQDNNKALILARKTTSSHQRFYLQGVSDAAGCPTVTPPTVPTEPTTPPVEPTTPTTPPSEPTPPTMPTNPSGTNYGGNLDGANCVNIWGWVFHKDYPNAHIVVEVLANTTVVGTIKADVFRQDLKNAKKGNGDHSFNFAPPAALLNGQSQAIRVRVAGTNYYLSGGTKTMTCHNASRLGVETAVDELTVQVYPNPTSDRVYVKLFIPNQQTATLRLTDLSGRLVWQNAVTGAGKIHEVAVDIPGTVTQTVLLSAQIGTQTVVRQVIIRR